MGFWRDLFRSFAERIAVEASVFLFPIARREVHGFNVDKMGDSYTAELRHIVDESFDYLVASAPMLIDEAFDRLFGED